jgi:hypothetical protein
MGKVGVGIGNRGRDGGVCGLDALDGARQVFADDDIDVLDLQHDRDSGKGERKVGVDGLEPPTFRNKS